MKFKPMHDRVLVKRTDSEEVSPGGILIPGAAQQKPLEGVVIAAGVGRVTDQGNIIALSVNVGDRVVFTKFSGAEIKIEGSDYLIMKEDELLGVLA